MKMLDMTVTSGVAPAPRDRLRSGLLPSQGREAGPEGASQAWSVSPNLGLVGNPVGGRAVDGLPGQDSHQRHQPAHPHCHQCCNSGGRGQGGRATSQSQGVPQILSACNTFQLNSNQAALTGTESMSRCNPQPPNCLGGLCHARSSNPAHHGAFLAGVWTLGGPDAAVLGQQQNANQPDACLHSLNRAPSAPTESGDSVKGFLSKHPVPSRFSALPHQPGVPGGTSDPRAQEQSGSGVYSNPIFRSRSRNARKRGRTG